ncbi:MAG: carbohydrate kinase family protein [Chloroflexi bacterium]|nr:carbohydrate kinase family protein [Chloroflexota bacterium]
MSVVITGSLAFDYLMSFPGYFKDHILLEKIETVSLSFLVDSMRKQRGGCASNIAYNLALLGERPLVMATAGQDFAETRAWLESVGVDTSGILEIADEFTASFFVSTDRANNQIASFYTGAMSYAHQLSFRDLPRQSISMAVISPNDPRAMVKYPLECQELGIPYMYDPSQQIVRLEGPDLLTGARGAEILISNDYEFGMLSRKTGLPREEILGLARVSIITDGERGSLIVPRGEEAVAIPAVPPTRLADPTGVGDAYRAGVLKGLRRGYGWPFTGRMASLAATYALEENGTQNHHYTLEEFAGRFEEVFGPAPELADLRRSGPAARG